MGCGYDGLFPQTPYGFITILPGHLKAQIPGTKAAWTLKGEVVRGEDGQALSGEKARAALLASFQAGAAELPATAEGCLTLIRRQPGGYQVWLIDPGQLDASGCEVSLKLTRPQEVAQVTDAISGVRLELKEGKAPVRVPAGTFRVIEVRLTQP
jgi:hypothetical protein